LSLGASFATAVPRSAVESIATQKIISGFIGITPGFSSAGKGRVIPRPDVFQVD
jgi:hypothetical protein